MLKKEMLLTTMDGVTQPVSILLTITVRAVAGGVRIFDPVTTFSITATYGENKSDYWYTTIPNRLEVHTYNDSFIGVVADKGYVDTDGYSYIDLVDHKYGAISLEVVTTN